MKNSDQYFNGPDGTLWTRLDGLYWRPSTVEELEGYCRERNMLLQPPSTLPAALVEQVPLPIAV